MQYIFFYKFRWTVYFLDGWSATLQTLTETIMCQLGSTSQLALHCHSAGFVYNPFFAGSSEPADSWDNNQQPGELTRGHPAPPWPDEAQEAAGGPEEEGEDRQSYQKCGHPEKISKFDLDTYLWILTILASGGYDPRDGVAAEEEEGGREDRLPSLLELQDCCIHDWRNLNLFTFSNILTIVYAQKNMQVMSWSLVVVRSGHVFIGQAQVCLGQVGL